MRENSRSKTLGVKPCSSLDEFSSNNALVGPHIVKVFPLPVYENQMYSDELRQIGALKAYFYEGNTKWYLSICKYRTVESSKTILNKRSSHKLEYIYLKEKIIWREY